MRQLTPVKGRVVLVREAHRRAAEGAEHLRLFQNDDVRWIGEQGASKRQQEGGRGAEHDEPAHAFLPVVYHRATPFSRQALRAAAMREGMLIPTGQ